jgi:LPXTG-site transpeptidase (sortase) family protein
LLKENNTKLKVFVKIGIVLLAFSLIAYSAWGFWQRYHASNNPNPVITTETVTHSSDTPDETTPYCDDSYVVPADEPRKIQIPSIGVDGCIQKVGVDQNNAIAVPSNIHVAGWYTESVLPGAPGLSIIDGHVLGRYNDAIFANLKDLKNSDTIRIEMGDTSQREFVVDSVNVYSVEDTMSEINKPFDGERRLALITCDGTYNAASSTYDKRIIVRAKLE